MVSAFVGFELSSGEHTQASVYSMRSERHFRRRHHTIITPPGLNGEQTGSHAVLFRVRDMFFLKQESRNKSHQPVVFPHANPHKTLWSSS
jgi:hypothetical protein